LEGAMNFRDQGGCDLLQLGIQGYLQSIATRCLELAESGAHYALGQETLEGDEKA
jgi:hypothetical protein